MKQDKNCCRDSGVEISRATAEGTRRCAVFRYALRLGFAYAKLNKIGEARDVLTEAVKIPGPAQSMSQDLLAKVNAARRKEVGAMLAGSDHSSDPPVHGLTNSSESKRAFTARLWPRFKSPSVTADFDCSINCLIWLTISAA